MKRFLLFLPLWLLFVTALFIPSLSWAKKPVPAPPVKLDKKFAERPDVKAFIDEMVEKNDFETEDLVRFFHQFQLQEKALKAIVPRSASVRSWKNYRTRSVEQVRIDGGVKFWNQQQEALEAAQKIFGVPEEIIVAILGIETVYGRNSGHFPTFSTLATLAFEYPPRAAFFRKELEAFLLMARDSHRDPLAYRSSYAGALGIPQFLPTSVRNWAVDFDGDGRVDLAISPIDAIGSVANFLKGHGWETGGPVTLPATVTGERYTQLIEDGILPKLTPAQMIEYGVTTAENAPQQACALIDLATPGEPVEYWLGYKNFYVITRYNRSSFYAMSVYALAQEIRSARERQSSLTSRIKND